MTKSKNFLTALTALVLTALVVAACGDTATNTPGAASGASTATTVNSTTAALTTTPAMTTASAMTGTLTTPAMTTPSITTSSAMTPGKVTITPGTAGEGSMTTSSAMTSPAMTSPAMTTAAGASMTTSSAMTTPAMATAGSATTTSSASTSGSGAIPTVSGLTEIPLTSAQTDELNKTLKVNNASIKLYSADDDAATVATNFDKTLTGQGYAFGIPGSTSPLSQSGASIGLYSKSGSNDVLFVAATIPAGTDVSNLSLPGLSKAEIQQVADQLKGKKTVVIGISGPGLLQALIALGSSGASGAMTTSAATPSPTK